MQVTARDVEREHRTQLKRWKKKRGEPSRKPPQRMHSARAIMATEPHTRYDLRQNPTIIVQYPSIPEEKSESGHRKKRGTLKKNQAPFPSIPNPYALPSESKPSEVLEIPSQPLTTDDQDVVPPSPPSYPPPLPIKQENQLRETNTSTQQLSSSNSSLNQKPAESLSLQNLSLHTTPTTHASPPEWRSHLLDTPPVQFLEPVPNHDDLPNNTENSAAVLDPSTSPSPTHNAYDNEESTADPEDKNSTPHNSTESITGSEDTYL